MRSVGVLIATALVLVLAAVTVGVAEALIFLGVVLLAGLCGGCSPRSPGLRRGP